MKPNIKSESNMTLSGQLSEQGADEYAKSVAWSIKCAAISAVLVGVSALLSAISLYF